MYSSDFSYSYSVLLNFDKNLDQLYAKLLSWNTWTIAKGKSDTSRMKWHFSQEFLTSHMSCLKDYFLPSILALASEKTINCVKQHYKYWFMFLRCKSADRWTQHQFCKSLYFINIQLRFNIKKIFNESKYRIKTTLNCSFN